MNRLKLLLYCCVSLLLGIALYGFVNQLIIFRFTALNDSTHIIESSKKKICLHYWVNDNWHNDTMEIVWSNSSEKNLLFLITHWLTLLRSEDILAKPISVQSVIISPSQTALYISFDRNLCAKEFSTYKKWMLVEGLLKTLRDNGMSVPEIFFLTNHQPMQDTHLDFAHSWPLNGYLQELQ